MSDNVSCEQSADNSQSRANRRNPLYRNASTSIPVSHTSRINSRLTGNTHATIELPHTCRAVRTREYRYLNNWYVRWRIRATYNLLEKGQMHLTTRRKEARADPSVIVTIRIFIYATVCQYVETPSGMRQYLENYGSLYDERTSHWIVGCKGECCTHTHAPAVSRPRDH